jgi:phosphoserine phosphatase
MVSRPEIQVVLATIDITATSILLLQAPALPAATVAALARAAGARAIVPVGAGTPQAYALETASTDPALVDAARAAGCDAAFVPAARRLRDVRLVVMDMDSTLITIECIDEIADMQGIKAEVSAITASAMRGEIEFAESLRRRVALLAGLPMEALESVYQERLRISPGAERMIAGFQAVGAKVGLVSGGFTFFTDRLKERLGLDFAIANTLGVRGGSLTGAVDGPVVDAAAKANAVRARKQGFAGSGGLAVALGDGANDLSMFAEADLSIAYRAKPVVRERATHTLDHCGLDGALNFFR